jgi:hypothetical protein
MGGATPETGMQYGEELPRIFSLWLLSCSIKLPASVFSQFQHATSELGLTLAESAVKPAQPSLVPRVSPFAGHSRSVDWRRTHLGGSPMKMFLRLAMAAALVAMFNSSPLAAQSGRNPFSWYIGGTGGVLIFETPRQQQGGMPVAGGNLLVTAKRTALLVSVEEGFGSKELSSYTDPSAPNGIRDVSFNDIRKYSFVLMLYPLRSHAQPFIGVGYGLLHIVNPFPLGTFATPDEQANAKATARDLGSTGFGTASAGLQLQVGGVALYGMYQITTAPSAGKLLQGPTHTFSAGLRVSLGSAKEGITGGGY